MLFDLPGTNNNKYYVFIAIYSFLYINFNVTLTEDGQNSDENVWAFNSLIDKL